MSHTPRRVAFVVNDLLYGGAQQVVLSIAQRLDPAKFSPVIYYLNEYTEERPSLKGHVRNTGVPLVYVGDAGKTSIGKAATRLARFWKTDPPAIVHAHLVDASIAAMLAGMLRGVPVLLHEHQTHEHYSWKVRLALGALRPFAARTLCYSESVEQELFGSSELVLDPPDSLARRSCTIPNGVSSAAMDEAVAAEREQVRRALGIPPDATLVVSVARLVPWKGQRVLLEAFSSLSGALPRLHLCLVGEGELRDELGARAAALGLTDRVHILGARSDALSIVAASDMSSLAYLYASDRSEGIGLAGLESMGIGVPVIASDYPSTRRVITDGETGLLVEAGDPGSLAQAIRALSEDDDLRSRIGQAAAHLVRSRFVWEKILPIYERIYTLDSTV